MNEVTETKPMSKRGILRMPYGAIMDKATIGDILFFISDTGLPPNTLRSRIYRKWLDFNSRDTSNWHTTIYVGTKKESKGAHHRPYIVHSDKKGTTEEFVPPSYFTNTDKGKKSSKKCRIEIVHNPDLSMEQRKRIVEYSRSQLGKPFDGDGWSLDFITYSLGLRSKHRDSERVSCHGLAYLAYGLIGLKFPHQLRSAPNLFGRIFGYPIGHPIDHVDLAYNYLRDHHLYRDSRFKSVLAVIGDGQNIEEVRTEINPGKYSWDIALQVAYGLLAL